MNIKELIDFERSIRDKLLEVQNKIKKEANSSLKNGDEEILLGLEWLYMCDSIEGIDRTIEKLTRWYKG